MSNPSPLSPSRPSTEASDVARRSLRIAAIVEPVSLLVLVVNLATVHVPAVASLVGPIHGTIYLVAIAATWTGGFPRRVRLWAWPPVIGALVAMRVASASVTPSCHADVSNNLTEQDEPLRETRPNDAAT